MREETSEDIAAIRAVHTSSFPTNAEASLVDALRAAGRLRRSLVAVVEGEVVGHVAFSPITLDGAPVGFGLAPLAVRAAHRRRGIAERLVRHGLELCRCDSATLVVVLGDPRYYERFGFRAARLWSLRDEYQGGDAFQALELVSGTTPLGGGLVKYAPEFAAVGT